VKLVERPKVEAEHVSEELEKPVAVRSENRAKVVEKEDDYDLDYLDIPAFLRRQAD